MRFSDQGRSYNTQDMVAFRTGDLKVPFIFMTPDHEEVFLFLQDSEGLLHPAKATATDILQASESFGIAELRDAGHLPAAAKVDLH